MNRKSLRKIYIYQTVMTLAGTGLLQLFAPQRAIPYFLGCFVITLNFALLTLLWKRVLDKKPVAITLGLIITKYAVLAVLIYVLANYWSHQMVPVFLGLTTLLVSILIYAFKVVLAKKK